MTTGLHTHLAEKERHVPYRRIFLNASERTGDSEVYTVDDLYKTALQLDTAQTYYLSNHSPTTWTPHAGGTGENNVGANVGTGEGTIYRDKTGVTLNFKKLQQGANITITNNADEIIFAAAGGGGDNKDEIINEHFMLANLDLDEMGKYGWRFDKAGTGNDLTVEAIAGHPGVVRLNAGTTSSGFCAVFLGQTAYKNYLLGGSNTLYVEAVVRFGGSIATTSFDFFCIGIGWDDWDAEGALNNGVVVCFKPSASPKFRIMASQGGAMSIEAGTTDVALDTWYRIGFEISNPGSSPSMQLKVNGSSEGSPITTNFPLVAIVPGVKIESQGTPANYVDLDRFTIKQLGDEED